MKKFLKTCYYTAASTALAMPGIAFAQDNPFERAQSSVGTVTESAGVGQQQTLEQMIGNIINIALGFIGILLLIYILYAGFLWMTAGGSDENVKKAQTMIKNAVIGLLIVVAAFAISNFVLGSLINVTQ
ncbi:MAG: Mbov_0395 family pilin-like conjugal transfer protein [Patescibacteria group bacterium]